MGRAAAGGAPSQASALPLLRGASSAAIGGGGSSQLLRCAAVSSWADRRLRGRGLATASTPMISAAARFGGARFSCGFSCVSLSGGFASGLALATSSLPLMMRSPAPGRPPLAGLGLRQPQQQQQTRGYRMSRAIDWYRVKTRIHRQYRRRQRRQVCDHSTALHKFRLTRFGWQHLEIGKTASDKRFYDHDHKKRLKKVVFLPRDRWRMIQKLIPRFSIKYRDFPDAHALPNMKRSRQTIGAHLG
eukprot:gene477-404_t